MNPEIKAKWVAALRSGEYKQGKRALRSIREEFCCLGVLCDLFERETHQSYKNGTRPPQEVVEWAALAERSPQISGVGLLVNLNDGFGVRPHTFHEIADLIEKHL